LPDASHDPFFCLNLRSRLLHSSENALTYKIVYTDNNAASAYDARVSAILNYTGKNSGQTWKNWSSALMGFDIQNEAWVTDNKWQNQSDPTGWVCSRADHIRSELGYENPIKVCSGGVGGSYANGINDAPFVTGCGNIDLLSIHYYGVDGLKAQQNWLSKANGKLVHVEEWTTNPTTGDQEQQYAQNAGAINGLGIPWCFWPVLPNSTCPFSQSDPDKSGIFIDDPTKDLGTPMRDAQNTVAAQSCKKLIPEL
jgi:mannan endo-1,4-beta-mannosidase